MKKCRKSGPIVAQAAVAH